MCFATKAQLTCYDLIVTHNMQLVKSQHVYFYIYTRIYIRAMSRGWMLSPYYLASYIANHFHCPIYSKNLACKTPSVYAIVASVTITMSGVYGY